MAFWSRWRRPKRNLDPEVLASTLDVLDLKYSVTEGGMYVVQFLPPDGVPTEFSIFIHLDDNDVLTLRAFSGLHVPVARRGEALSVCNQLHRDLKWPKIVLLDRPDGGCWFLLEHHTAVVEPASVDLLKAQIGIFHASVVDTLRRLGACFVQQPSSLLLN